MPTKMKKTETVNESPENGDLTFEQQLDSMGIPSVPEQETEKLKKKKKVTMDSVTVSSMLSQAIHSNDTVLLEKSLEVSDRKIIQGTVSRLASSQSLPLLDLLVVRLQRKPHRAHILIEWIKAVLLFHSSYLSSVPELTTQLEALYKTLDARQSVYSKLLRLSGRLDLITSQMETRASRVSNAAESEPLYTYNEEDDEEEEEEEEADDYDDEFPQEDEADFDEEMVLPSDHEIMDEEEMEE